MSKKQNISRLAYPGAGFMHNHFSNSDAKANQTSGPLPCAHDLHAPAPEHPATLCSETVQSLQIQKSGGLNVRGHRL